MTIEGPTLFMSNHQFPPRMWPAMIELGYRFRNTEFVCDAPFAFFLNLVGLHTINVDTTKFISRTGDQKAIAKHRLISMLGSITATNIEILREGSSIERICDTLTSGKNVFICPQTVTKENAPWRKGVGVVCKNVDLDRVRAGFVFVPKPIHKGAQIYFPPVTIGSLIPNHNELDPAGVVKQLEKQYIETYGHL